MKEEWKDEDERERAYENLFRNALRFPGQFEKLATEGFSENKERWVVARVAVTYSDGFATTPLQAVRNAIELELDGGWNWAVWDREAKVGYLVRPNTFIYEPVECEIEHLIKERIDAMTVEELDEIIRKKIKEKKNDG